MRTTLPKLVSVLALVAATASAPVAARFASPAAAGPALTSIGTMAFAADGTLFAADPQAATIFALDLGAQTSTPGTQDVPALNEKLAAMFGTDAAQVAIRDLAVHPKTHNSFVSVMRGQGPAAQPVLVRIDGAGKIEAVSLEAAKFTSVTLPNPPAVSTTGRNNRAQSITHMALVDGSLYVTGLSNEEFASKFWAIPYPFKAADQGASVEIWHTSHNKFETNAPILAFVPTKVNNTTTFIAGYTCTPLVRFPVTDLKPGSKVMGTTIAEAFGAGNQPIDMIMYKKAGHEFVLMANTKHGILKIATDQFGTAPALKEQVPGKAGVPGESIASMPNVIQLDLLDATRAVTLTRTAAGAPINLVTAILP